MSVLRDLARECYLGTLVSLTRVLLCCCTVVYTVVTLLLHCCYAVVHSGLSRSPLEGQGTHWDTECHVEFFARRPDLADILARRVAGAIRLALPGMEVECKPSEKWILFARDGENPQNMHYDEVEPFSVNAARTPPAEAANDMPTGTIREHPGSATQTANGMPRGKTREPSGSATHFANGMRLRAWMPILPVVDRAPLLLFNTTLLYEDDDARLERSESLMSSSNRLMSGTEFRTACAKKPYGCACFHTLGMRQGELLVFRNSLVLHGTPQLGIGTRLALALDCAVSPKVSE
jgi:hypothetical protein